MRITKLHLKNFRGAADLDLELHPRLNVFVGLNGAGKSTVLDAAAIALSWLPARIANPKGQGRPIRDLDIRNGGASAEIEVTTERDGAAFAWQTMKTRKGYLPQLKTKAKTQLIELAHNIREAYTASNGDLNVPLLVYFPVQRAGLDIPKRIRKRHEFDVLSTYEESLTSGADFRVFFEWFQAQENLENERIRDQIEIQGLEAGTTSVQNDRGLNAVRQAISTLVPEFGDLRVRRNPLRMELTKTLEDGSASKLRVDQLSGGEQALIALVGDLARRLALANPTLERPLEGEGIVMIDEIDLHLHPSWQRMVIPRLREVFPKLQFVVTTHSPAVITHVKPESLFTLELTQDGLYAKQPTESFGKTANAVLEDVMRLETTRPDSVQKGLTEIFGLIQQGKVDDANATIEALEKEIGADPELVRAKILIRRWEVLGK